MCPDQPAAWDRVLQETAPLLSAIADSPGLLHLGCRLYRRVTGAGSTALSAGELERELAALPVEQRAEWTLAMLSTGWRATARRLHEEELRWSRLLR